MVGLNEVFLQFLKSEDGPTAVEYAFLLALIIMVCFVAVGAVGSATSSSFNSPALKSALSSS